MRYRCIMAGFDPDTPEEMQEFIRVSTLFLGWRTKWLRLKASLNFWAKKWSISDDPRQALEDEHPLPNVVPQALFAGDFSEKKKRSNPEPGEIVWNYGKLISEETLKGTELIVVSLSWSCFALKCLQFPKAITCYGWNLSRGSVGVAFGTKLPLYLARPHTDIRKAQCSRTASSRKAFSVLWTHMKL